MYKGLVVLALLGLALCGCQTGNDLPPDETAPPDIAEDMAPPAPDIIESKELAPPSGAGSAPGVTAPSVPEPGLPLSNTQRFSDVPLPENLKEDMEHSYVLETEALQVGKVVYRSKASVNSLAQFYVEHCPAADWKMKSLMQSDGYFIVFEKPGKQLTVHVKHKGGLRPHSELVLHLTPLSGTKAAP